jgi:hypothetical protein
MASYGKIGVVSTFLGRDDGACAMTKKKNTSLPILKVPKNATLRQIYAAYKKQFSAADLQKYTEIEPMVPMEQVLADMEKIHREEMAKQRKKVAKRRKK